MFVFLVVFVEKRLEFFWEMFFIVLLKILVKLFLFELLIKYDNNFLGRRIGFLLVICFSK